MDSFKFYVTFRGAQIPGMIAFWEILFYLRQRYCCSKKQEVKNGACELDAKISQTRKKLENKSYSWDICPSKQSVNLVLINGSLVKRGTIQLDDFHC